MDNFEILKQNLDLAINPNAGVGQILAQAHNDYVTEFINKQGKYVGFPFIIKGGSPSVCLAGELYVNSPLNTTTPFNIVCSKFNADLNDMQFLLTKITSNDLLHIKDYVGRSFYFIFNSFSTSVDSASNPTCVINVTGLASNVNYSYQSNEARICVMEFVQGSGSVEVDTLQTVTARGNTTSLDVGIGVLNPTAKLHTFGTVKHENLTNAQNDYTFTKQLVAKLDGTLGIENKENFTNILYLSASGNDSTAVVGSSTSPFATLDGCVNYIRANVGYFIVEIISPDSFDLGVQLPVKHITFRSEFPCTINYTNTSGLFIDAGDVVTNRVLIKFDLPFGFIFFTPSIPTNWGTNGGFERQYAEINCAKLVKNINFNMVNFNYVDFNIDRLVLQGDLVETINFDGISNKRNSIRVRELVTTGDASICQNAMNTLRDYLYIEIRKVISTHNVAVHVNNWLYANVVLGDINATTFRMGNNGGFGDCVVTFLPNSIVNAAVRFGNFNHPRNITITGSATLNGTTSLFPLFNIDSVVTLDRCFLNIPNGNLSDGRSAYGSVTMIDSTVIVIDQLINGAFTGSIDIVGQPSLPLLKCIGVNNIFTSTNGNQIVKADILTNYDPYVEIQGKLYSNGVISSNVVVNKIGTVLEI